MPEESAKKYFYTGTRIILLFALIDLLLHLYSNAFANYGIFRDEYYYIACSKRLAAGYVDQPPFSIYILAIWRFFFGESLFAIRFIPAVISAITVYVTGLIVRKMNGGNTAVAIACLALVAAPVFLGVNLIYSMNTFDWLLSALTALLLIKIINEKRNTLWIWLGIVFGIGLLNKVGFLWLGFGTAAGLVLTRERIYLKTIWPYIAGAIALIIFSPFIFWNMTHNWAHLEFIRNATSEKYSSLNALTFISGFILTLNPLNIFIWLAGLYYFIFNNEGKKYRLIGIIFIVSFLVLIINGHSKSEYLDPEVPMLFAGGGIIWEKWLKNKALTWVKFALPVVIAITGILFIPLALPVLPVNAYISYSEKLGIKPSSSENKKLSELPQFYADMFGWKNMAATVSRVYDSLSPAEKTKAVVFAMNYGEAGSLEYYKKDYPLPEVISGHNNYWLWGYNHSIKDPIIIILGGRLEDHLKTCDSVRTAAVIQSKYAMPYETNLPVFICKGMKYPISEIWSRVKNFE